jgi:hypothetical protein
VPGGLSGIPQLRAVLGDRLKAGRNADGGWAYQSGKRSRLEPTCWALLALAQTGSQPPDLEVLRRWPRSNGWLIDVAGAPPNHAFNALAALTLLQSASTGLLAEAVIRLLIASKGVSVEPDPLIRQDGRLQGWSWTEGTFSWVEPTAWSVLVLKQRLIYGPYPDAAERIRVGEQMLKDRECEGGGWNYGNSAVYSQDLQPYVPTTALSLIALQDRRSEDAVARGLRRLQADMLSERSAVALSLTAICLRVHGLSTDVPDKALTELMSDRDNRPVQDNGLLSLAMALCALSEKPLTPFTVGRA